MKFLRQSATLTGLGNTSFNSALSNIAVVHAIFKRAIGSQLTDSAIQSTYTEFPAIDMANRYFTPQALALAEDVRPLTVDVDPHGTLAKAAGTAYVHTEENKVYYFQKMYGSAGEPM